MVEEEGARGQQRPPHVSERLWLIHTSFPEEVDWHKIQHGVLDIIDLLLKWKQSSVDYWEEKS